MSQAPSPPKKGAENAENARLLSTVKKSGLFCYGYGIFVHKWYSSTRKQRKC